MHILRLFAFGSLVLGLSVASALAGTTLRYPAGKPAVVVDVPEGWTATEDKADTENHQLTFSSKDENLPCQIILMTLGKLEPKQYKELVKKMGELAVQNAKMADPSFAGPLENKSGSGTPLTWEVAKGKVEGSDITLMIGLFTQKNSTYAVIISSESSILENSAKTADQIIDSVAALK